MFGGVNVVCMVCVSLCVVWMVVDVVLFDRLNSFVVFFLGSISMWLLVCGMMFMKVMVWLFLYILMYGSLLCRILVKMFWLL